MLASSEMHRRTLQRVRSRVVLRDVLAWMALGVLLSALLLAWFLATPDFWAGRRFIFTALVMAALLVPPLAGAWWPWRRRGDLSAWVRLMAERGVLDDASAGALQLALGRVAAGSDEAVELALESIDKQVGTLDLEPLQRVPRPYRRGSFMAMIAGSCGLLLWGQGRWADAGEAWATSAQAAAVQRGMTRVSDLTLVLHYPAYLKREAERLEGSDGSVEVPEGTRVELKAHVALEQAPEAAAVLVDGLRVAFEVAKDGSISGSFLARRSGNYRLALVLDGEEVVEREGHRLTVLPDEAPKVVRRFPEEPLELDAAKIVEFLFEASDDHGVAHADVVYRAEGRAEEQRQTISLDRTGAQLRQKGELDLKGMDLRPGDTLHWVIEVRDNNDVTGPSKGRSRWHRIHFFDPNKRLDELLEALDRLVASLADRLAPLLTREEEAEPWSKALAEVLDKGAELADKMKDKRLDTAGIRRSLKTVVRRLRSASGRYAKAAISAPVMEDRLERDLLYLDDLLSKRRLKQLARLQEELRAERAALERLVQQYRETRDDEGLKAQILASIRAMRQRLEDLGKKMARLERRVGREYVNKDALKNRSVGGELDKLEAMVRAGRVDEAMAALDAMTQALNKVDKQVQNASERFGSKEWREAYEKGKAIQEQLRWLKDRQQRLRGGVENLRREARRRHLKAFGSLKALRQELQRKLAEARGELAQMTHLEDWLQHRVKGMDDRLQRADKALAADGYAEALEELRRAQGRLESLGWMLNEPGSARKKARVHQAKALDRVGEAVALLERLLPDESDALNPSERRRLRQGEAHQNEVSERLKKLGKMMTELKAMAPVLGGEAMGALGQAKQASRAAGGFLAGGDAVGAGQAQADVLSALEALEKKMGKGGQGGSGGMPMPWGSEPGSSSGDDPGRDGNRSPRGDRVKIPESEQGVPGAWREEILEAWGEGFAGPAEKAVDRYYRELVR